MIRTTVPFKISVASPCHAPWEDMGGDERVRFCDHCQKHIFNLSSMTTAEATALVDAREGRLCARFHQRRDGTVLTSDCPVGARAHWRRLRNLLGAGAATILLALVNTRALSRDEGNDTGSTATFNRLATAVEDASEKLAEWLRLDSLTGPPVMMGKIAPIPRPIPSAPATPAKK